MRGIVYKSTGSWYAVLGQDGQMHECRIKGKFRVQGIKSTNPVAVGDVVQFELEQSGDTPHGVIFDIVERRNYMIRKSVNLSKQTQIIAANIDQALLLITLNNPPTLTPFIDRFLVTAEAYDIPVVLVFNKMDSYSVEERFEVDYLLSLYRSIGYTCLMVSALTGDGVDALKRIMEGKTSLVSGHSGVGKSTLINTISPGLDLRTGAISLQHAQGTHTTTFAEMFDLSFGGRIIDTPGIKGFGVVDMEQDQIGDYFPEFFALKSQCKYHNCTHMEEPFCAVKTALDQDKLAWSRYKSYVQLMQREDEHYRVDPKNNEE
ncbi:MAG: ribosome small subunit-dependent GTPase A [Flavobacteriaceae bacterium]|jgi:ribosome biogenesis GTPase|nr:ribosome small subunit-dependent GTPase A [Flavobacteriaceae bacterium]MDP4674860.1 ribosome small subunit-dependent GTPase A [Flavobacteriaceae bacterium]MDP4755466.1 ribosome small subunit-dependent GTPase A [Flavobacteriaceae bacterium]MDP4794021.1 ribosome small subunit-dependent GTPase A [Flavobacteriaceae bacterium]MDP4885699.1 ribosome small subunit-dependent GTPase A [Flavobacteriaceae bacterium]